MRLLFLFLRMGTARRACALTLVGVLLAFGAVSAGELEPPAGPGDPASAMHALDDVYNRLTDNTAALPRSGPFQEPAAPPGATGHTLDEVYEIAVPTRVPKTGQTTSYATGDDGDLEAGVAWPDPRFTIHGDGTVTNNLTRLMWLQEPNCISVHYPGFDNDGTAGDGRVTWQHALDFAAGVNAGSYPDCAAGYADWRLANFRELLSLMDFGASGYALPDHPFGSVGIATNYWSSTTYAPGVEARSGRFFQNGVFFNEPIGTDNAAWLVRNGD
jgi:hypothetical protein